MSSINDYLLYIGSHTVSEMQMALGHYLLKKFKAEYEDNTAYSLSAAVVNKIFSQKSTDSNYERFVQANHELIKEESEKLSDEDDLCELITYSIYSLCHIRHLKNDGKRGLFNPFLGYIRALSLQ